MASVSPPKVLCELSCRVVFHARIGHEKAVGGMEGRKLQIQVAVLFVDLKFVPA